MDVCHVSHSLVLLVALLSDDFILHFDNSIPVETVLLYDFFSYLKSSMQLFSALAPSMLTRLVALKREVQAEDMVAMDAARRRLMERQIGEREAELQRLDDELERKVPC